MKSRYFLLGAICVATLIGCSSSDTPTTTDADTESSTSDTAADSTEDTTNDTAAAPTLKLKAELVTLVADKPSGEIPKLNRAQIAAMLRRTPGTFFLTSKRPASADESLVEVMARAVNGDFAYDAGTPTGMVHFRVVDGVTYLKVEGDVTKFFPGTDVIGKDEWAIVPLKYVVRGQDWAVPPGEDSNPFGVNGGISSIIAADAKLTVGGVSERFGVKVRNYKLVDVQGSEWSISMDAENRLRALSNAREKSEWEFAYGATVQAPKGAKEPKPAVIEAALLDGDMASITEFALTFNDQLNAMKTDSDGKPITEKGRRAMSLIHAGLHGELPEGVSVSVDGAELYTGNGEHADLAGLPETATYLQFTKRGASVCLRLTADGSKDAMHDPELKLEKLLDTKGTKGWALMYRSGKVAGCSKVK
jgi:hypothetical protein